MDLWDRLENIIPMGKDASDARSLRKKAEETTGDLRSMSNMELYRIYNSAAGKRRPLSLLLRRIAKRRLRLAIRYAEYFPDPLEMNAALLAKGGDLWEAAKQYEEVIPRQRAWIDIVGDPDGSRQLNLCLDLATTGETHSQLGQFDQALFWYMDGFEQWNRLPWDLRTSHTSFEDPILSGVTRSLVSQFRYEDALVFLDRALEEQVFSAYQSDVRQQLSAYKELLPELVSLTREYQLPDEGLKLWADLMQAVQRCKTPEEARDLRRTIFDTIETHKTTKQICQLKDAIESLLKKNYAPRTMAQKTQDALPAPLSPDFSATTDPKQRETFEKVNNAIELLRRETERQAAQFAEIMRKTDEELNKLNQMAIAEIHESASKIYRVPRWFRVQWGMRRIMQLVVMFVAIEFLIGEILAKLLKDPAKSMAERLHFSVTEGFITVAVALALYFLSMPAEKRLDDFFLATYKRLLQKLVANRVTTYWVTYNVLLKKYNGCKLGIEKLMAAIESADEEPMEPSETGTWSY